MNTKNRSQSKILPLNPFELDEDANDGKKTRFDDDIEMDAPDNKEKSEYQTYTIDTGMRTSSSTLSPFGPSNPFSDGYASSENSQHAKKPGDENSYNLEERNWKTSEKPPLPAFDSIPDVSGNSDRYTHNEGGAVGGSIPRGINNSTQRDIDPNGPISLQHQDFSHRRRHHHHHHHHHHHSSHRYQSNLREEDVQYVKSDKVHKILWGKRFVGLPYFTILVTIIQSIVFLYELIKMGIYTKTIFQTKPYFNPMLGPSSYVEINVGARYTPCMVYIDGITDQDDLEWPCPNSTSYSTDVCSLQELCGMSGLKKDVSGKLNPNQWYRMITAIFIHAGFVHILMNFCLQLFVGCRVERFIGVVRYSIIYMTSGIAGFLLGSNFTSEGIASMGASGSLFGSCISVNLVLLVTNGNTEHYGITLKTRKAYYWYLCGALFEVIIMIFLGLLPGLDNFSHIGGFVIGCTLSIAVLNDPKFVYKPEFYEDKPESITFMESRRRKQFVYWCLARGICIILTLLYFILLAVNLAKNGSQASESCEWCKYLNCLPINGWCDQGNITIENN